MIWHQTSRQNIIVAMCFAFGQVALPYIVGMHAAPEHVFMKVLIAEAFFFQFFKNQVNSQDYEVDMKSDDF